jgi:hypothetical protein
VTAGFYAVAPPGQDGGANLQCIFSREGLFPQLGVELPCVGFHTVQIVYYMFQSSKETRFVEGGIADARYDAIVSLVGRQVMQRVRFAGDSQALLLEVIDPTRHFRRQLMRPLVKFLRHDLEDAEGCHEKGRERTEEECDRNHGSQSKGSAKFVHVVAETSFGDGPWGRVVTLKGGDDTSHDGGFTLYGKRKEK